LDECICLHKDCVKPVSRMLARAFADDLFFTHVYPDATERRAKLPYLGEYFLRYGLRYGQAHVVSPQLEGIAVWMRLKKVSMPFWKVIISGGIWPALKLGRRAIQRLERLSKYIDGKHRKLVPVTHWYLALLAVAPEFQGRGYASKLMRGMLPGIDEEGLPCYLETESERNVPIYQHFGFKVIDEFIIPETTVNVWAMLRESK